MAEKYDPVPDLARLLHAALLGDQAGATHAERIAERLGLGEDDSAETITAELRKALGLGARTVTYDMAGWDTTPC